MTRIPESFKEPTCQIILKFKFLRLGVLIKKFRMEINHFTEFGWEVSCFDTKQKVFWNILNSLKPKNRKKKTKRHLVNFRNYKGGKKGQGQKSNEED